MNLQTENFKTKINNVAYCLDYTIDKKQYIELEFALINLNRAIDSYLNKAKKGI